MTEPERSLLETRLRRSQRRPQGRSALLIGAYCSMGLSLLLLLFGSGVFWVGGTAAIAILLGIGEIVAQLSRR